MASGYHEVVIEGARGRAYGFVEGFLVARGLVGKIFHMEQEGFDCEPLRERVRQMFNPSLDTMHVLVQTEELPVLREAEREAKRRKLKAKVLEERPVAGARFRFEFRIYSREHAARIRRWFDERPEGVSLSDDTKFEEVVDPDAAGLERLAPVHDYELHGRGTASGEIEGIVELYRLCRDEELVDAEPLQIFEPGAA